MENTIEINHGITRHPTFRMREPINLKIGAGEQVAVVGRNASGKSVLIDTIIGRYPLLQNEVHYHFPSASSELVSDQIKYIAFRDSYGDADSTFYYQQRWNMHDQEGIATVGELLPSCDDPQMKTLLFTLFDIDSMFDKPIIQLSSGEMRKFQLVKALSASPRLLVLDNPFLGLDKETRDMLQQLLARLIVEMNLQLILVLANPYEIPAFITHVIPVENKVCGDKVDRITFQQQMDNSPISGLSDEKRKELLALPQTHDDSSDHEIIRLNKVSIRYGERVILKELDWVVRSGEHWALTGRNGSGKSTLLGLVCADSPQSYACDISLFGRKRGSGESIWDIKKRIGYVSPEMHRAYLRSLPAIDIVASGIHDSIGLYKKVHEKERERCRWWMNLFGLSDIEERMFTQLSSGEQRMVLLARAFVKDPDLLILDEPMHGLDPSNRLLVKDIIETFCERKGKTLVMVTHYPEELPDNITDMLTLQANR